MSPSEAAVSPSLPERFGRYEVASLLATGGMAEVYLAKLVGPERFERAVVVKRILPHLARDEAFRTMFLDEARLAAWIHHPNVVTVHELAQADGELYLVMDYVEGETLASVIKQLGRAGESMPVHVAVHVLAEACAGLHAAHELKDEQGGTRGIVHRDVSPQNLMVDYHGTVRVLDFGIASAVDRSTSTQSGVVKGKFAYMSPEQARAQKVDRQTDVFALGVVLYELTTGSRLFARPDSLAVVRAICDEPIPTISERRASCPEALDLVARRALARDKADRYATAAEMRRELLAVLRDIDPEGRAPEDLAALMQRNFAERQSEKRDLLRRATSDSHVTRAPWNRRRPLRWVVGALALALGGAAGYALLRTPEPPREALVAAPASALRLQIASEPVGATVELDGVELGVTPLDVEHPRDGRLHRLQLTHEGFETKVEFWTADVDQRLRFELRAIPPPEPTRVQAPEPEPEVEEPADEPATSPTPRRRTRRPRATTKNDPYFRL
ncbi:MAG: serine/threonine protein kinase [Sandaracinus sp.]|nr:serine/threonine protein kinase [Sandaracinus sp.]